MNLGSGFPFGLFVIFSSCANGFCGDQSTMPCTRRTASPAFRASQALHPYRSNKATRALPIIGYALENNPTTSFVLYPEASLVDTCGWLQSHALSVGKTLKPWFLSVR